MGSPKDTPEDPGIALTRENKAAKKISEAVSFRYEQGGIVHAGLVLFSSSSPQTVEEEKWDNASFVSRDRDYVSPLPPAGEGESFLGIVKELEKDKLT